MPLLCPPNRLPKTPGHTSITANNTILNLHKANARYNKVVNQIEAEHAGRVKKLIAEEGDEVEPGAVIAVIEEN